MDPKRERLTELLARGRVNVHVDPRREGVRIPSWLASQPSAVIELQASSEPVMGALVVDDDGVRARVTIRESKYDCAISWCAITKLEGEGGEVAEFEDEDPDASPPMRATTATTRATDASSGPRSTSFFSRAMRWLFSSTPTTAHARTLERTAASAVFRTPSPPRGAEPRTVRPDHVTKRCPGCEWIPAPYDQWACVCGHRWDTFTTAGRCPSCGLQWNETACLRCKRTFAHDDWYAEA
jgi:hypothetical protein